MWMVSNKPNRIATGLIALLMIIVLLFAHSVKSAVAEDAGVDQDVLKRIDEFVEGRMLKSEIPGLMVIAIHEGETVYKRGFGHADSGGERRVTPETLFELGSNSKAFTGLAIRQLIDEGKIMLDAPISH